MASTYIRNYIYLYGRQAIVLIFFLSLFHQAEAQMNRVSHDDKKIYFGIMMGSNTSSFKITHSENFIRHDSILVVESPNGPGFNLGIVANYRLNQHFDLRSIAGISFFTRYLDYQEIAANERNIAIESISIQLPLDLKFKSDRYNNFRFYVVGGARAEYDLASNSNKRKANDIIKLKRFDFAAEYGIGFQFFLPMVIIVPEVRLSNGFYNIHTPTENFQYSDVIDDLKSRAIIFSLIFEG